MPDFSALTFTQVAIAALAFAAADTIWNIVVALAKGTFSAAVVAKFLETHVFMRIVPVLILATLGSGQFGLAPIPVFFDAALAALAAYATETVGSIEAATQQQPPAPSA